MLQYYIIKLVKNYPALNKFLSETEKKLSDFFGINIEKPSIFFLNSRKDIDKILGKKTEDWFSAWVKNGNIYILNHKIYTKESNHNIKHFWQTIKHEYCHLYFQQLTGTNYPKWLNEGLACYFAEQAKKIPTQGTLMKIFDYFQKSDWQIYSVAYFWVNFLIEKFGRQKILNLLKSMNFQITEEQFAKNFYKIYQFHYSRKDFDKILKKFI